MKHGRVQAGTCKRKDKEDKTSQQCWDRLTELISDINNSKESRNCGRLCVICTVQTAFVVTLPSLGDSAGRKYPVEYSSYCSLC